MDVNLNSKGEIQAIRRALEELRALLLKIRDTRNLLEEELRNGDDVRLVVKYLETIDGAVIDAIVEHDAVQRPYLEALEALREAIK